MVSKTPDPNDGRRTPRTVEVTDHLLSAVNELAGYGEELRITASGRLIGSFLPAEQEPPAPNTSPADIAEAIDFIGRFGSSHSLGGLDWKSLRDEGRR